jgi:hypothetical protein
MSHVVSTKCKILDLLALQEAAESIGLEFRAGQTSYRWYGHSVGDYPLPAGFSEKDLGKCVHALHVKGNNTAYEIGIVKSKVHEGYELVYDFWNQGHGLLPVVGTDAYKLTQAYYKITALKTVPLGCPYVESKMDNGEIVIEVDVPEEEATIVQY